MAWFEREDLVDHIGAYRTVSLFMETNRSSLKPLMTLKEVDWEYKGETLPSLKKIYMELADPTEYAVAIEVLGSWPHWERLCDNKDLTKYFDKWRDELEIKIRSGAIKAMMDTAVTAGSKGTTAAKFLADKGWVKRRAGAPSKEEVHREMKIAAAVKEETEDDAKRLGLH